MAENDNVVNATSPEEQVADKQSAPDNKPTKKNGAGVKIKEWFRKQTVALKRAPQNITLVYLAIVTVYFLLVLFNVSQAINSAASNKHVSATGICIFIVTLLSILVLVSFLNAFPKRKKPNIFFIVLTFVMIAGMVACDLVYYIQMNNCLYDPANPISPSSSMYLAITGCQPLVLVHIILLGVGALLFALLPVYSKLLQKINTQVVLESATENMNGEIDILED